MRGIYKIYNKENNNTYIGQSKNIENRLNKHIEDLKNNKHHQRNLQKEYNNLKKNIKNQYKCNELFDYIDYDKLVFEKYYGIEVLKAFDYYNLEELLKLEDEYILKYRNIQEGYNQKTNEEIKSNDVLGDIFRQIEESKKSNPSYWEFINNKIQCDEDIFKELREEYLNKNITLSEMQDEILKLTRGYYKDFKKITK